MTAVNAQTLKAPKGAKLKALYCGYAGLKKLDISHFKKLETLEIRYAKLTELNVSGNLNLSTCSLNHNKVPLKKLIASKKSSRQKKLYQQLVKDHGGKILYK